MTAPSGPGVKGEVTIVELTRQERSAARRSAETRAIVPSVELACQVEMDACLEAASARGCRPLSLVLAAVAGGLRSFPRINGAYRDGQYELYSRVNLGVNLPGVVATLFDAAEKLPEEIDAELDDLVERAATGGLSAAELSGSTFTVIPPGDHPVTLLTPLIQPPQAAALAVGPTHQKGLVRDGAVTVGHAASLTLACDHRIVPVTSGAEFLGHVKTALEASTG